MSEPPPQAQDSFVNIVLQFDRVVKSNLCYQGIFGLLRQFGGFREPLERAARLVVDPDFFRTDSGFTFEFLGRHEEVEQGDEREIDVCQEGLLLEPLKAVIADIFTDDGAVFLLDETVVVFPPVAASGKGDTFTLAPNFRGVVDKFRTVVAVKLPDRQRDSGFDMGQSLESSLMGVIEEETQFDPS